MKKILIAGNWKMNNDVDESLKLVSEIESFISEKESLKCEVLVCPTFLSIFPVSQKIKNTKLQLGAQNCYYEPKGAFTGEISIEMLATEGVSHIIIGHSERRAIFNETDELINKKLSAILESGLTPILCIGETLDQREQGKTYDVLSSQLDKCLLGIQHSDVPKIVIAYEPIWAIGTGVSATTSQVDDAHNRLRKYLLDFYADGAKNTLLLYGGSLNEKNAAELLALENVNGGLIGGASLKSKSFTEIINIADDILK